MALLFAGVLAACAQPDEPQAADVRRALSAGAVHGLDEATLATLHNAEIEALDCRPDGAIYACSFVAAGNPYTVRFTRDKSGRWGAF